MPEQRYLVTARKYRPQLFNELVAQEHVTETLKNAIRLDRLAHSYLFSGPRGVGKTTAARILAKAINCTAEEHDRSTNAEPCRQCASCRSFEEGRNLNIYEIDAASNNKVEDVREIRETVRIPPQGNRKKVYIIDEVHMLSNAAFNALLKTLEEPPPHVLFIFATTEPHKVLPTILSRCQRFDFRRIPVPEIITLLQQICEIEQIEADEASLLLIARKGDGALRDALSVFDQAVSLCGTKLMYQDLAQALGVVDVDLFFEVSTHIKEGSSAGMLHLVERIVHAGFDLQEFLVGLAEHLRNLMVALTMEETSLIEAPKATRQRYEEEGKHFGEADLLRMLMILSEAEEAIKSSTHPRLKLEIALIKMAGLNRAVDLREALHKLDRLEFLVRDKNIQIDTKKHLGAEFSGAPRQATYSAPSPRGVPFELPKSSHSDTTAQEKQPVSRKPSVTHAVPQPKEEKPAKRETETPGVDPLYQDKAAAPPPTPLHSSLVDPDPNSASPDDNPVSDVPDLFGAPALKKKGPSETSSESQRPLNVSVADTGSVSTVTFSEIEDNTESEVGHVKKIWAQYVQAVKEERIHVGSLLEHASPDDLVSEHLVVTVPDDFHQRLLTNQHDFLLKQIKQFIDQNISVIQFRVKVDADVKKVAETPIDFDPYEYMQKKRKENPVIRAIFDQFGGELVW